MGIVLDTSAIVDIERGGLDLKASFPPTGGGVYLPAIVLAELWIGVELASNDDVRKSRMGKIRSLMEATTPIPFGEEMASTYARLHVALRKGGKQIPSNDLAVASTAIHFGHDVLVGVSDEAHFRSVPGLKVLVLGEGRGSGRDR